MKGKINYFIIQYGWVLSISAFAIFLIPVGFYRHTGTFYLKKKFQPQNKPPIILLHASDPHLSSIKPKSYPHIKSMLNKSKMIYKPDLLIISGDLTDNFIPTGNVRPYYMQYEPDWNLYNKLMDELNFTILKTANENSHRKENIYLNSDQAIKTIQIIGNHDLFCVGAFNSSSNYLRNTIKYDNITNFELSTTTLKFFDKNNLDDDIYSIKFVNLNRYSFPVGPIAFIQISFLTKKLKQRLFSELTSKKDDSQMTIVVSHIPVLRHHLISDIENILKSSLNTRYFLSGHWHPPQGFNLHVGKNVFELVAPPLFKSSYVYLIVIDNGISSNHFIDLNKPEFAIISHPSSIHSKSELDAYSPSSGEIRAVTFGKKSYQMNLTVIIDNDFKGQLKCPKDRQIKEDVYLCTLHYENLKDGVHTLIKAGDWSGNLTFSIGSKSPSLTEYPYINEPQTSWTVWLIISWIATFYIVWPFRTNSNNPFHRDKSANSFNFESFHKVCNYLINSNKIIKSFNTMKSRIHMLPLYFQRVLFIEVFWCMFLPISFFETEGKIGVFHVLGNVFYLGNNKSEHYTFNENCLQNFKIGNFEYRYHYMGAMYGIYFLYFHIFPILLIVSEFIASQGQNNVFLIINIILFILSFRGAFYQFTWLVDMFGFSYALCSPLMLWFPISLYLCLIIWIFKEMKMNNNEDSTELSQSLLYQVSI